MKETYFQILKSLIQIPSPAGSEQELANFIEEKFNGNGWIPMQKSLNPCFYEQTACL